jgi:hypothetical protein
VVTTLAGLKGKVWATLAQPNAAAHKVTSSTGRASKEAGEPPSGPALPARQWAAIPPVPVLDMRAALVSGKAAENKSREEEQVAWLVAATTPPMPFVSSAEQMPEEETDAWNFVPRGRSADRQGRATRCPSSSPSGQNAKLWMYQGQRAVSRSPAGRSRTPRPQKLTALEKRQRHCARDPSGAVAIAYQWADYNAAKALRARAKHSPRAHGKRSYRAANHRLPCGQPSCLCSRKRRLP